MELTHLSAQNFRTFEDLDIDLEGMEVLIGANASGKSNFLNLIEFISDLADYGLEDAVYLQGGITEVRNRSITDGKNFKLNFKVEDIDIDGITTLPAPINKEESLIFFEMDTLSYSFELDLKGQDYEVINEKAEFTYELVHAEEEGDPKLLDTETKIIITRENNTLDYDIEYPDLDMPKKDIKEEMVPTPVLKELEGAQLDDKELVLESQYGLLFNSLISELGDISVYDIEPGKVKTGTQVSGKKELEKNGENLSVVLDDIGKDDEKRSRFNELSEDLVPFIDRFEVEKNEDRSFVLKLVENFFGENEREKSHSIASMISDGTINIYSLIVALFFENKPIIGIEEPGRNIHPALITKLVRLMEEASLDKQVIATTHDPDILKSVKNENVLLVQRNDSGFTEVKRPMEDEVVSTFLKNEIGIEELHRDNIMG